MVWQLGQDAAAAVDCGDVFYGFGRAVWAGRHYWKSRVWAGFVAAGTGAFGVESVDEPDGGRVGFSAAGRGWVLLLGQAGAGWVLGVSGGVAEHGGKRVRHGDLPGDLCDIPGEA